MESTHTRAHAERRNITSTGVEVIRRHRLAAVGVGHQVPQVRLLDRADVRLLQVKAKKKKKTKSEPVA
jgi:hypothetical protein